MAAVPIFVNAGDKVWLRNGVMGFVHKVHTSDQGFRVFDISDTQGNVTFGLKRTDFFVIDPELTLLDPETIDQLMEGFDEDMEVPVPDTDGSTSTSAIIEAHPIATQPEVNIVGGNGTVSTKMKGVEVSKEEKTAKNRFKTVTEETLDELANSTTAKATDYQTKWAVKALKGKGGTVLHLSLIAVYQKRNSWFVFLFTFGKVGHFEAKFSDLDMGRAPTPFPGKGGGAYYVD